MNPTVEFDIRAIDVRKLDTGETQEILMDP